MYTFVDRMVRDVEDHKDSSIKYRDIYKMLKTLRESGGVVQQSHYEYGLNTAICYLYSAVSPCASIPQRPHAQRMQLDRHIIPENLHPSSQLSEMDFQHVIMLHNMERMLSAQKYSLDL